VTHPGVAQRHAAQSAARGSAALLAACLTALACSGATDVVGILDDTTESTESLSSAAPSPDEAMAVVQGRPLPDWRGEVLDWPLSVPLRELFASDDAAPDEPSAERYVGSSPAPTRWSRAARRFSRSSFDGEPSLARIDAAIARGGRARSAPDAMRSVVLRGDAAERLLSLFAGEAAGGMPPAAVVRDENGDVYQIVLDVTARRGDGSDLDGAAFDDTPRWRTGP
jgi:hypothetical protein